MSRRPVVEDVSEDEFDDDTDLPLPKRTLPNTGSRGALLEEIDLTGGSGLGGSSSSSSAGPGTSRPTTLGSSSPAGAIPGFVPTQSKLRQLASGHGASGGMKHIDPDSPEAEKFKKWTCVYPIYIDAKRAYGTGGRKVSREKSVWWPKSLDMANAAHGIGLLVLHEASPSDL
ncbi:signal recognition particle subunit [Tulasnella sp. 418]|nr:signal recognition particle subunit [Tulasnella sp. 418]